MLNHLRSHLRFSIKQMSNSFFFSKITFILTHDSNLQCSTQTTLMRYMFNKLEQLAYVLKQVDPSRPKHGC